MAYRFNPLTGKLDLVNDDVQVVATAPTTGQEGIIYQVSTDPTKSYYFSGGHRYVLVALLDDPVVPAGADIFGLLLTRNLA